MDYEWILRIHKKGAIGYYSEEIISFMQEGGQSEKDMLENWGGVEVITLEPDPSLPSIRGTTRVHKFAYQLFTHKDVPNEVVRDVVLALHKNAETFRKASGFTKSFDETNMHNYDLVPMHEGAIEAYETLGLSK